MPAPFRKSDVKGLCALGWRIVVVMPIVMPLGMVALIAAIIAPLLLPVSALLLYLGEYLGAFVALCIWILWFVFRRRITRFVFEGFEHAGM